ncbi:tetratricopeptide repeat protein [Shewanella pneumatophori]|uniref:Sel1 repeat family protein n=1 Tax=Shewanella pneumatophori TaxID=314092 RepID=A0A9X1ZE73_9GAMM|nr:tetratricopeptide repeat protein [Shewanella pneumatophori]MCL1139392.1 sel1 repeat family protein [Shewanella pneumatophori]
MPAVISFCQLSERLFIALMVSVALIGCSSQPTQDNTTVNTRELFDPWCNYAADGLAEQISQKCIDNAAAGDVDALTNLAYLYAKGILVEQDFVRAMVYYRKAAHQGMPEAQYSLAEMYRGGRVGKPNYELARYWYQQLASQAVDPQYPRHQVDAQFMLGLMHFQGLGDVVDLKAAQHWLTLSSNNGHSEAPYVLGKIYLEHYHQPAQAFKWYQVSAEREFAPAMHQIGMMYIDGTFGKVDAVKAETWLERAASLGLAEAQVDLATSEYNGMNGEADFIKIYVWLDAAAGQGNAMAKQRLEFIAAKLNPQQLVKAQALSKQCSTSQFKQCNL